MPVPGAATGESPNIFAMVVVQAMNLAQSAGKGARQALRR